MYNVLREWALRLERGKRQRNSVVSELIGEIEANRLLCTFNARAVNAQTPERESESRHTCQILLLASEKTFRTGPVLFSDQAK